MKPRDIGAFFGGVVSAIGRIFSPSKAASPETRLPPPEAPEFDKIDREIDDEIAKRNAPKP